MTTLSPFELAYCVVVILLSYGMRGSTGFGGAVGMPLLALVIPIKVLIPVWTLMGFASSVAILGAGRRRVSYRAFVAFCPWCVAGVAVGLYLFTSLDARSLARGLGLLVLIYAALALWATTRPTARGGWLSLVIGPVAGALAGAVGTLFGTMGSVFIGMYLDARALTKDEFLATMSALLLALSTIRGIGYYAVGEFTLEVWLTFAAMFPLMLIGIYFGDRIQMRISELTFRRLVCAALFLCGIPLLLK